MKSAAEVLRLDAGNFELAVQTYTSLAVLFYDHTPLSEDVLRKWEKVRVPGRVSGQAKVP